MTRQSIGLYRVEVQGLREDMRALATRLGTLAEQVAVLTERTNVVIKEAEKREREYEDMAGKLATIERAALFRAGRFGAYLTIGMGVIWLITNLDRVIKFWQYLVRVWLFAILLAPALAIAQEEEHFHPPQDIEAHEKFYSTWYMPDNPARSCCNKADCYPTEIKMQGRNIYARRREDGKLILVPPHKIELNRDNPDGRNHMCAPPPEASAYPPDTVFCFALGGGI
jgi:hypothetical protein